MKKLKRKSVALIFIFILAIVAGVFVLLWLLNQNNSNENTYPTEKFLITHHTSSSLSEEDKDAFQTETLEKSLKKSIEEVDEVKSCDVSIEKSPNITAEAIIILNSGAELQDDRQAVIKKLIKNSINDIKDENITLVVKND